MLLVGDGKKPVGRVDVGHEELDPVGDRVVDQGLHLFARVHHHAQVRRHESRRMVRFQVRRLVSHVRVRRGVRLVEAVARELFHEVEDFRGDFFLHVALGRALHEDGALTLHLFDVLLTHGTAQQVGAAERIAAHHLRDSHHLFLIDHDAVGFAQHGLHAFVEVLHLFATELSRDEGRNEVHRAGSIERVQGDEVFETVGTGLLQKRPHPVRFELEDGRGVRFLE